MRIARCLFIIWLLSLAALSSCGGQGKSEATSQGSSSETPQFGGTLVRHLESDCKTLNWVLYSTTSELYVLRYLYDNLLDYDENLEVIPVLAEEYSVDDDHLRITVRLRENVQWHDGTPVTAEDIKFTVDKIIDPTIAAVNKAGLFSKLDRVDVIDERTVVFVWKEPYAPALDAIANLAPMPKHIYGEGDFREHPANRAPVGSGPYKFEEWQTSQSITLVRNDLYYGQKPYIDKIIFRVIPDRAVALNALKTGELDEMRLRQPQWDNQTNDPDFLSKFNKTFYDVPQYNYLSWNCRSVWFKDRRVRLAMAMLFDRQTVNEKLYSGYAKLVSGPFYINSWAYDRTVEPLPYDPDRAKTLLTEAGWTDSNGDGILDKDGSRFEFEFSISSGSSIALEFAQLLQEACSRVGIQLKIRRIEGATFFDKVFKGEYDAAALAWRLDNDPDIYDTFHSTQVPPIGLNHAFYHNAKVDSLLELGRAEFNIEKRAEIYHQVHREIASDPPYTFINTVPEKRPISKRIGNVIISPRGPFDFFPGATYWFIKNSTVEARS